MQSHGAASDIPSPLSRRAFLTALGVGVALIPLRPRPARPATETDGFRLLRAGESAVALQGDSEPATPLWSFDGGVPGPVLRFARGTELRLRLRNELPAPIRMHWRGARLPDALGGLSYLAGEPVTAGESRDYRLGPPDAGTFWYRAAFAAAPAAQGLHGLVVVDEAEPVAADRDVALVFDDWRLGRGGTLDPAGHGRLTANGGPHLDIPVRTNERLRLRLLNASPTRLLAVGLEHHRMLVMAIDGQPAEPFAARDGRIVLAPGNRADLFVDATLAPGAIAPVTLASATAAAPVARLVYAREPPARPQPLPDPAPLPANPLPARMAFAQALRLDLALDAAAMREARRSAAAVPVWTPADPARLRGSAPLFSIKRGRTAMLAFRNPAAVPQTVHLHGHHFRLLDALDDGWKPFWLDTLAVMPGQTARIAFVADNPGRWLLERQMLEGAAAETAAWFEVA